MKKMKKMLIFPQAGPVWLGDEHISPAGIGNCENG